MSDAYKGLMASSCGLSAVVFIASSLYLFISHGGIGSLISLNAAVFLGVGLFTSAVVIGLLAYLLQKVLVKAQVKALENSFLQKKAVSRSKAAGDILMLVQIAVTFFLTKIAFTWFIIERGI